MKRGRSTGRYIIVVYKQDLSPHGVFVNSHHLQENIGIQNANIVKYLDFQMFSLGDYIAVQYQIDDKPITDELFDICLPDAEKRKAMQSINKLTVRKLNKLRPEQILAINKIISGE